MNLLPGAAEVRSYGAARRAARRVARQEVQLRELGKAVNFPLMSACSGDGIYQQQDPRLVIGQLAIFTAYRGQDLAGLATTVTVPASLQLGCYWQLRDLYVDTQRPALRGRARAAGGRPPGRH